VIALLYYTSMFPQITVPNERTRVYLVVALIDDHSLSIDGPVRRFGKTADIARSGGHYYTDKAPGTSLIGAAVYGMTRVLTPKQKWSAEKLISLMRFVVAIPIGILGFFVLRRLLLRLGIERSIIDISSAGWILGTAAFHYSTAFYGHQIAGVALLIAVYLLHNGRKFNAESLSTVRIVGAGAAAGLAGLTEYQSIIPCLLLAGFFAYANRRRPAQIFLFIVGALPFAAALLGYHQIAFGGMLELPYQHLASKSVQALHSTGIAGVGYPKPAAIFGALFSLHRGLIATSPIFLLVPYGLCRMLKTEQKPLGLFIGLLFTYYLLFIFGAEVWYAGWSFGPRLVVPVMGLALIPCAVALSDLELRPLLRFSAEGAVIAGICYNQVVHVVFPELPETATNPIQDVVIPALRQGVLSPNRAADLTGTPGLWTLIPLAALVIFVFYLLFIKGAALLPKQHRLRRVLARFAPGLALGLIIALAGPSWSPKQSQKFVRWMQKMERAEHPETADDK